MQRKNWTDGRVDWKVENSIATTEEIELAYRLVLGRKADDHGLRHFRELARSRNLGAHEIAVFLMDSDEFRAGRGVAMSKPVEIRVDDYSIFVLSSDRDIGNAISLGVRYEPHVSELIRREVVRGDTFMDVGANIGFFSMMAAHLVGPKGKVIAIEPMDKNLQLIYLGIRKNGFMNVEVFPFGASDRSGLVPIVTDANTSNALIQSASSSRLPSLHASTRTLDWMCADLGRLDFLKMDIEGHEVLAWRGAAKLLARCKPKIATEFHPLAMRENAGIDCRDYVDMMFEYARDIRVLVAAGNSIACSSYEQVMNCWQEADKRAGGHGSSHLDLFLLPKD
jgi:FkbM family methyltransferase